MVTKFWLATFCLACLAFLSSCGNAGTGSRNAKPSASALPDDVAELQKQVMKVHEQTMLRMDSIMQLKRGFRTAMTSGKIATVEKDSCKANISRLQKAEDDMTDWMHQYRAPDAKDGHDKNMAYLNEQLKKIQVVQTEISESFRLANNENERIKKN